MLDKIDTEEKAYWLGFIWCDGYVCKRERYVSTVAYEFKLSLKEEDVGHLEKLKTFLKSNHVIRFYRSSKPSFKNSQDEARLYISNKYFGCLLYETYGMIPNRSDSSKLINSVPEWLFKHFVRGVLDADGSIVNSLTHSYHKDKDKTYINYKSTVNFSTYQSIIEVIQDHLYKAKVINQKSKIYKRHEDRDGECVIIKYCGNKNVPILLNYLYKDATIYLDRKYNKYKEITNTHK